MKKINNFIKAALRAYWNGFKKCAAEFPERAYYAQ